MGPWFRMVLVDTMTQKMWKEVKVMKVRAEMRRMRERRWNLQRLQMEQKLIQKARTVERTKMWKMFKWKNSRWLAKRRRRRRMRPQCQRQRTRSPQRRRISRAPLLILHHPEREEGLPKSLPQLPLQNKLRVGEGPRSCRQTIS